MSKKLHFFMFVFMGKTKKMQDAQANTRVGYPGWRKPVITYPMIERQLKESQLESGVCINVVYLGKQTIEDQG